mmetsp:Transcript_65923/g.157323  ORF Transcript_65923/g.157323 Transcript_65923/m.157323 type:complete len:560 (-) Transcript_65923:89-1768(-)|eukprot:CAMPEP_0180144630 /NCGR_PEP_ID=MMETSP0986-20121125/17070_1 /TAXON_ID=697907 /ORGANISM="non described non described, Strain CCMP2293" /LENGTH=559 /DNA_ID=CAMNT_0022088615 /DNA_START=190 /DNA_END=1869 /DNA_ORIENTATION=+
MTTLASLQLEVNALTTGGFGLARDLNVQWLVITGLVVIAAQLGIGLIEAASTDRKNQPIVLFKNMVMVSIACIAWWLLGHSFAFGKDVSGFIGDSNYGGRDIKNYGQGDNSSPISLQAGDNVLGVAGMGHPSMAITPDAQRSDEWEFMFQQMAVATFAISIISGPMAGRTRIPAYFVLTFFYATFFYPIMVHWGWGQGWMSAFSPYPDDTVPPQWRPVFERDDRSNGMIDWAGAGVVHVMGGFVGLTGALWVGARKGRFVNGEVKVIHHANHLLHAAGVLLLWFAMLGFHASQSWTLADGKSQVAAKVCLNTLVSAAAAMLTGTILSYITEGQKYNLFMCTNSLLAGLVAISSAAAVVSTWYAFLSGMGGGVFYVAGHYLLRMLKIDDPTDSSVVHGFVGIWGLWCAGIGCTDTNVIYAQYRGANDACERGEQFGVQVIMSIVIVAWAMITTSFIFLILHVIGMLRVSEEDEELGFQSYCKEHMPPLVLPEMKGHADVVMPMPIQHQMMMQPMPGQPMMTMPAPMSAPPGQYMVMEGGYMGPQMGPSYMPAQYASMPAV